MLIFFGTGSSNRPAIQTNYTCPACGRESSIVIFPHQRYFHIFWIPIFPIGKEYSKVCRGCGANFSGAHLPITPQIRNQVKTPLWTYFGLLAGGILFFVILMFGFVLAQRTNSEVADRMESPRVGDVYEVKLDKKEYSLRKIAAVTSDSVYFYDHEYNVDKATAIDR